MTGPGLKPNIVFILLDNVAWGDFGRGFQRLSGDEMNIPKKWVNGSCGSAL
jgi:hypothetical protein